MRSTHAGVAGGPAGSAYLGEPIKLKMKPKVAPWGSDLWKLCTYFDQETHWEYSGMFMRLFRILVLHVWLTFFHPISYLKYTWMYSKMWFSPVERVIFMCSPILGCILLQFKALLMDDLETKGPWWSLPEESLIKSMLASLEFELTPFVGGFWVMGTNEDAMKNSWHDYVGHKDYWRAVFLNTGTQFPREVGRYEKGEAKFPAHQPPITFDVVCKIKDSGCGVGDQYWQFGSDFSTNTELKHLLNKTYSSYDGWDKGYRPTAEKLDKPKTPTVIVMEWMKPLDKFGVHSLEVLTIRSKARGVEPVQCLLWMDCRGNSSLSAKSGYVVDLETETVCARADFYGWQFTQSSTAAVGVRIPGVKNAAKRCMALHRQVEYPFLNTLAFDFMITHSIKKTLAAQLTHSRGAVAAMSPRAAKVMNWAKSIALGDEEDHGEAVFFDGSFACHKETQRLPRRFFMTWKTMFAFFLRFEVGYTLVFETLYFGVTDTCYWTKFMVTHPFQFLQLVIENRGIPSKGETGVALGEVARNMVTKTVREETKEDAKKK